MAKCNYIKVEAASRDCRLQAKVNGIADKDLNVTGSAPHIGRYEPVKAAIPFICCVGV